MTDQPVNPDITSDDKLWALLTYVLSPVVPIIILLMEDKKNRPFLKSSQYSGISCRDYHSHLVYTNWMDSFLGLHPISRMVGNDLLGYTSLSR